MSRNTHDRLLDHHNVDLDTNVVLDGATSSYISGSTVHAALDDLDDRVAAASSAAENGVGSDLLLGDNSDFAASLGSWAASGGTLTRDTTNKLYGSVASLKFVNSAQDQYVYVPLEGTFKAGKTYWAVVMVSFEEETGVPVYNLQFGNIGVDWGTTTISLNLPNALYNDGSYMGYAVGWTPTADRTSVTLRLIRTVAATAFSLHVGFARVFQVMSKFEGTPVIRVPGTGKFITPISSSSSYVNMGPSSLDGHGFVTSQHGGIWMEFEGNPYSEIGTSESGPYVYGVHEAGDYAGGGFDIEVGSDWVGLYISEKDENTVQIYPDSSDGYDVELKDRGSGKHWYAVDTDGNRVKLTRSPYRLLASAPSTPAEGDTYYDTTTHKVMTWDGTNWQAHW